MSALAVQLERPGGILELGVGGLGHYAEALGRAWDAFGVSAGDRVAIYDYGPSPVAYLASRAFAPYLERGAAEITSSMVLCVDGLPDNAKRVTHVLRYFNPRFLFARADMVPLLVSGPTAVPEDDRGATLVVTADGELPAGVDRRAWEEAWPGGVGFLLRWDAAAFLAPLCPTCGSLRVAADLYDARVAGDDGLLFVEPRFLASGQVVTGIEVREEGNASCCGDSRRFEVL